MQRQPDTVEETVMPLIGGILIIISGITELSIGGAMVLGGSVFFGITLGGSGGLVLCGVVFVVLALVAIIGGMFAIQRRNFNLAMIGGIISIGGTLGLIGLILVAVSKDEFED